MPGKGEREEETEGKVYSIKELSPEARKRVLEKWRYKIWDDHDSDQLSDSFKEILSERGFRDPEVCWSLSYSQGDGVAFSGYINLPDFFKWIFSGDEKAKPFVKEAKQFVLLQEIVSVKVYLRNGPYCHWNSMSVEVEITGNEMDFVPEKHREEVSRIYREKQSAFNQWQRDKWDIEQQRNAPIYEWNQKANERSRQMKRGPKEWRPIEPKPAPLDLPIPPEPEFDTPVRIQRMIDKAVTMFSGIDPLVNSLEMFVAEWVKDTSRELEKIGYEEIDYRQSDENIIYFLEENEYTFDEEGEEL